MSASNARYVFFTGDDDQFYWRLVGRNGEIMAVSEGYTKPRDAWRAALRFREVAPEAVLSEDESADGSAAHDQARFTENPVADDEG